MQFDAALCPRRPTVRAGSTKAIQSYMLGPFDGVTISLQSCKKGIQPQATSLILEITTMRRNGQARMVLATMITPAFRLSALCYSNDLIRF